MRRKGRLWDADGVSSWTPHDTRGSDRSESRHSVLRPGRLGLTMSWGMARLWNAANGTPIGLPNRSGDPVGFGPDGRTVVVVNRGSRTIGLWRPAQPSEIGSPLAHEGYVGAAAFSPDDKTVLTGSHDKTARLSRRTDGSPIGLPMRHGDRLTKVAFSPDGKTVLTGSDDKSATTLECRRRLAYRPADEAWRSPHRSRVQSRRQVCSYR